MEFSVNSTLSVGTLSDRIIGGRLASIETVPPYLPIYLHNYVLKMSNFRTKYLLLLLLMINIVEFVLYYKCAYVHMIPMYVHMCRITTF
jgi:hypothetical protein